MTHSILDKTHLGNGNWLIKVELKPDTPTEIQAVNNTANLTSSEAERELVENYLHFNLGLGNYSVVSLIRQVKNTCELKVYIG